VSNLILVGQVEAVGEQMRGVSTKADKKAKKMAGDPCHFFRCGLVSSQRDEEQPDQPETPGTKLSMTAVGVSEVPTG
jgi:hypothetical protein